MIGARPGAHGGGGRGGGVPQFGSGPSSQGSAFTESGQGTLTGPRRGADGPTAFARGSPVTAGGLVVGFGAGAVVHEADTAISASKDNEITNGRERVECI
jgi:hypothetical protein